MQAPPYGRELADLIAGGDFAGTWGASPDGRCCTIWLLVGADAWNVAKAWRDNRRLVTLLPPGADPCGIRWQILAGHDPILLYRCGQVAGDIVEKLLRAIMAAGVRRVLDISTGVRYVAG